MPGKIWRSVLSVVFFFIASISDAAVVPAAFLLANILSYFLHMLLVSLCTFFLQSLDPFGCGLPSAGNFDLKLFFLFVGSIRRVDLGAIWDHPGPVLVDFHCQKHNPAFFFFQTVSWISLTVFNHYFSEDGYLRNRLEENPVHSAMFSG